MVKKTSWLKHKLDLLMLPAAVLWVGLITVAWELTTRRRNRVRIEDEA